MDEHVGAIPGSTQRLLQGVSRLAVTEWPSQPLFNVALSGKERESLRRAARASVLSSAAYSTFGVLLVEWTRSPLQLIRVLWQMLCGLHRPHATAFQIHTKSLGLTARDLLHAQWRPRLLDHRGDAGPQDVEPSTSTLAAYVPAHFIAVDHAERAVVLVIRGTLALEDVVTIVEVAATPHDERELGRGCHGGMAAAARTLVTQHGSLLEETLRRYPGYRLDIAGHSLGAGIATFAAVLLRRSLPRRTKLHAYAFAPPCTLPLCESRRHDALVDAYVYAADVVPRLSIGSIHRLCEAAEKAEKAETSAHDEQTSVRAVVRDHVKASHRGRPTASMRFPTGRLRQLEPIAKPWGAQGSGGGVGDAWRRRGGRACEHVLLRPCRRGLGLIRLRRSMFRDHGFDRYECALTSLASSGG